MPKKQRALTRGDIGDEVAGLHRHEEKLGKRVTKATLDKQQKPKMEVHLRKDIDSFPIADPLTCVILVAPFQMRFANSVEHKKDLLRIYKHDKENSYLLGVWPGKYQSHAFLLTEEKFEELNL